MSKAPRRWVTVENTRSLSDSGEKRKPSVFERLGSAPSRSSSSTTTPQCKKWATTGACNYGNTCRFRHGPKRSDKEKSPPDLRQKVVRKRDKESESDSEEEKRPDTFGHKKKDEKRKKVKVESSKKKKDKDSKVKSTIVVQSKYKDNSDESDSEEEEGIQEDDVDETMRLERKRQQLQRELSRLEAEDDSDRPPGPEKQSSLDETSDTGRSTPPVKSSHSREKYDHGKKPKQPSGDENPRKKSVERKKIPKIVKKKSLQTEGSSDEESYPKEKQKKKVVPEKHERIKRDRSTEEKTAKIIKSKKKQVLSAQVEKRSRTRTLSTSSTSSTSSSSTSPSSSSESSSSEEEYRRPRKKSTKSPEQRRRKSVEHKKQSESKQVASEKGKKDKVRNKLAKSPVKTRKGHSPSAGYDERQTRESPDSRERSSRKSLSPIEGRKSAQSRGKRSLSPPREGKRKSGVASAPRTRSPMHNQSPEKMRRERSQETGGRGRKGGDDNRRKLSPSDNRSSNKYDSSVDGVRYSRRPQSPDERQQRDRRDNSNTRRVESPENTRRDKQRSLDRQSGRRNVSQESYQRRQPTPEQRGRQGRENRDSRGGDRRAISPDGSNERGRKGQSPSKGRRGASQDDEPKERPSPSSKYKQRQDDGGRRQVPQDSSDRQRHASPPSGRERARSPVRGQERIDGNRGRRPVSPDQDRGKSRQGISADRQRKGRSPPARDDLKGRKGRSPQRQPDFDRNRGQQDYRDIRDSRDNVGDDNIQSRILSMAGYQSNRRGNDRRGDRTGREMEYRKNNQDDGYERNVRDRDQSKGRQPQFHDDYQDQGMRDRRGDRLRYDEMHDQRRGGRDQQWDDRRGEERYLDEHRVDVMRDRHGREMDNRAREGPVRRSDGRKRPLEEDRGRSPPNKQQRRDGSPAESHKSASSRGRREDWEAKHQGGGSRDRMENEFERKGRDSRHIQGGREDSQKRIRSPSDDRRQPKRQKTQQEEKKVSLSADDRQKRPDSYSEKRGSTAEEFSDWSENDTDAELLSQPNQDKYDKNDIQGGGFEKEHGRERGRVRDSNAKDERNRRSQSRTSIGSRQSYRDDRKLSKEGGRNRDQRWKSDDREIQYERSDRKDARRDLPRKRIDSQDFKEAENDRASETVKEKDMNRERTGSISSSQNSLGDADRDSTSQQAHDQNHSMQDTEGLLEEDTDKKKLEYDEISDDDLDELIENADADEDQENTKPGIVDSLDIDWASLCSLSKPKSAPGTTSALKRYTGASIIARIGLSKAYAGDALFAKIQDQCRAQQEEDKGEDDESVGAQKKKNPKFEFLNDVAMLHGNALQKLRTRMNIMSAIGPHRRALCARKDLSIRRTLCKVAKNTEGLTMYSNPTVDQDLYKQSIQMLRQDRNSTEDKKLVTTPAVAQVSA